MANSDYIDEYLRQEIIADGATRNPPAFGRFPEVVWKRGVNRKTVETAKFYLFDTGVISRMSRRHAVESETPGYGHLFETWVHHELRSYLDVRTRDGVINYWRTPSGTEVDFIVGDTAIEVKSSKSIGRSDMSGLRAIAEEGEFEHRVVVCREPIARVEDGVEILPYREFIARLWGDSLITLRNVQQKIKFWIAVAVKNMV